MKEVNRIHNLSVFHIQDGKDVKEVSAQIVFDQYGIESVIRVRDSEFIHIHKHREYLTHFNLQFCHHLMGRKYGLVRIVKPGRFNEVEEILPVLSLDAIVIGECIEVRNHVPYDQVTRDDFTYSFDHIKSIDTLKDAILRRYRESMPSLSADELLKMGVSITKLRIIPS